MKRWKYCVFVLFVLVCLVLPVSATLYNGYYRVAPGVAQGATVFIGEQGLDISQALAAANAGGYAQTSLTTIGWWASAADIYTTAPTVSVDLTGRTAQFTVTQAEFDGYEGQWYLIDPIADNTAKSGAGAVFNVKAPKLDVSIRDVGQNDGADVSGTSVPQGSRLQFQIGTNMYTVLSDPQLRYVVWNNANGMNSDGYLDIIVKTEAATVLQNLSGDIPGVTNTLLSLNVTTQPFTWGRNNAGRGTGPASILYVWNTSTYPPGTYVVSVQSRLNNMQANYLSGTAAYTGRTVSVTKTITLAGDIPAQNGSAHSAVFRPSTRQFIFNTVPVTRTTFGLSTDIPITGDWNGDNVTDIGVFRPSTRQFIFNTAPVTRTTFGLSTDIPLTGDWDGDFITDTGVFRPSTRQFILNTVPVTRINFGQSTDIPLTGDWDDDGRTDIGIFRPSTRQFIFNTASITRTTFGLSTDIPLIGDWNDDGRTDIGVFRPSTRQFIFNTSPITRTTFGLSTDIPVTGKWM